MTAMSLYGGLEVLFDAEDSGLVEGYTWTPRKGKHTYYAQGGIYLGKRKMRFIQMHRLIMDAQRGQQVDHRNGNGLDNRRANLRFATNAENQMNRHSRTGSSQYKGVCWDKAHKLWMAYITVEKKRITLGYTKEEEEAAIMYDMAAVKYFGGFARPNFVVGALV